MSQTKSRLLLGLLRPKTLFSGLSPVLIAVAYAYTQTELSVLLVGLLVGIALSAQIASNIANDLIDHKKGADTASRLGPLRPLSRGLLSEQEVRTMLYISLAVLLVLGLSLAALSSWYLLLVAVFVLWGLFAYSGGSYPLSYHGLGDVAVLVFFGWVPTIISYYVLTGQLYDPVLYMLATSVGLSSVNILLVNNYRDVEEDRRAGKRTLIVRMGKDFAPRLYLCCAMMSIFLLFPLYSAVGMWLLLLYGYFVIKAYRGLQCKQGEELNGVLAYTARNVFFLALLVLALLYFKTT